MDKAEKQEFLRSKGFYIDEVPAEYKASKLYKKGELKPVRIVQRYPGLKQDEICLFGHPHRDGALVLFECGLIGPVGHECAKTILGEDAWAAVGNAWNRNINEAYAKKQIEPNLQRLDALLAALPQFEGMLKVKDKFFYRIDALCGDFYKSLEGAVLEANFNRTAMSTSSAPRLRECLEGLRASRAEYAKFKFNKKTISGAEKLYQREQYYIKQSLLHELLSTERFFNRAAITTFMDRLHRHNTWKRRSRLEGDSLWIVIRHSEWREFPIPYQLSGQIADLRGTISEIKTLVN